MKKEASRIFAFSILMLIMISLISSFALAQENPDITRGVTNFIEGIKDIGSPLFTALFGTASTDGAQLIVQVLAFFLVTLVVYGVLSEVSIFGNKPWINFFIGVIIAIIGIRFLPVSLLETAALPSSAFVAIIVMVVPFIFAAFLILRLQHTALRRTLYISYAVVAAALWIYNYNNNQSLGGFIWIYPIIILCCLIVFWFDGTIKRFFRKGEVKEEVRSAKDTEIERVLARLDDLRQRLGRAPNKGIRVQIERAIKEHEENLARLQAT